MAFPETSNLVTATIPGTLALGATSLTIDDASRVPSAPNWGLIYNGSTYPDGPPTDDTLDNNSIEIFKYTADPSGNTFSGITRGENGTTDKNHTDTGNHKVIFGVFDSHYDLLRKTLPEIHNVVGYGADPTGATSSTTAFDAAFTAAADGETVYVPPGTFDLSDWTTAGENYTKALRIRGEGKGRSILEGAASKTFLRISDEIDVEGVQIDDFGDHVFDFSTVTTTIGECRFHNCGFDANKDVFAWMTVDVDASGLIQRLVITDCTFTNQTRFCSEISGAFDSVLCDGNFVDVCKNQAFRFGDNDDTLQDTWKAIRFSNNTISNVTATGTSTDTRGGIFFGLLAAVVGNVVDTVTGGTASGSEVAGFYDKCRFINYIGNSIKDVTSPGSGMHATGIRSKGDNREGTGNPDGWTTNIEGNSIFMDGSRNTVGINAASDNVNVTGNHVEGVTWYGVDIDSDEGDEINVVANTFRATVTSGSVGVRCRADGEGFNIANNTIHGFDYPVSVQPQAGDTTDAISITDNKFLSIQDTGVLINPGSTGVVAFVEIRGNTFRGSSYEGVEFSGTATTKLVLGPNDFDSNVTAEYDVNTAPTEILSTVMGEYTDAIADTAIPKIYVGSGTPESVVAAGVSSLFLRTDGGTSTTLYVKETGTGNTGWIAK